MQITLNKWLNKKDYSLFYLENEFNAKFINRVPKSHILVKETKNKLFGPINIITGTKPEPAGSALTTQGPYIFEPNTYYIPFLKSHLQKCIRRGLTEQAIITSYLLMSSDMNQFLRRILIIIIEDVCLIPQYTWITWLMCADKMYKMSEKQVCYMLGIVKYLCLYPTKDVIDDIKEELITPKNDIVVCLLLRKSYGGLKGDMKMLQMYAQKWNTQKVEPVAIDSIEINKIGRLKVELSAIDFHCYPFMLENIQNIHKKYTIEQIKYAIWNGSSGINYRVKDTEDKIWNIIKDDVVKLQKRLCSRINNL